MLLTPANECLRRRCGTTIRASEIVDARDERQSIVMTKDGLASEVCSGIGEALVDEVVGERRTLREGKLLGRFAHPIPGTG